VTSPAPGGWASVTSGSSAGHTCALRAGGTLWCWGWNYYGQLGIGNHTDQDLPQQVTTPAPGGWASVTAGAYQSCAVRADSTLWCWGFNYYGQLGIGNHTDQDLPQQVSTPLPGGWASVTAGAYHSCAVRWGRAVVLGLELLRPARHRQPHRPGPAAPGHPLPVAPTVTGLAVCAV
jgi:Regulator of chromosome condensation (RCC1) repeat